MNATTVATRDHFAVAASALALGSALCWGVADFVGGLKNRGLALISVLLVSQGVGLAGALVLVATFAHTAPAGRAITFGLLAGAVNAAGIGAFYRGLAIGRMSVVAPIAGLGVFIPVAFGLAGGDRPSASQALGMAIAVVGVVLVSREVDEGEERRTNRLAILLAVVAAVGIGGNLVFVEAAVRHQPARDALWVVASSRAGTVALVALVAARRSGARPCPGTIAALVPLGFSDLAANLLFALAARDSLLSLTAVLASLHPVVTVALAHSLLRERVPGVQGLGVALAVAGAMLMTAA